MSTRTIKVNYLARVEGEGALYVKIRNGKVTDVNLNIFEPPRFFEAFLRGRQFTEAPDITARICGICPVAYQMSSVHAMENACGATVGGPLRQLRRLIYCGEWIESHVLHMYMLHAPDFLGYQDSIRLAKDFPDVVKQGLQLKKVGNEIVSFIGGREIHPINVRVGGFYKVPARRDFGPLRERLEWARDSALETVRWVATLPIPEFEKPYEFVSLRHPTEYPLNEGHIVSASGLDIGVDRYEEYFQEEHVARSTALHSTMEDSRSTSQVHSETAQESSALRSPYMVGPLARYSLNFDRLSPLARAAASDAGLGPTCKNPFQSIVVRAVETVYACDEAIRIIDEYEMPDAPAVDVPARAGVGYAATEAPRGTLYHRYTIDGEGSIVNAKIVPPTSQNMKTIEDDVYKVVAANVDMPKDALTWRCEQTVRNYDPCISCSTHFLRVELDRE